MLDVGCGFGDSTLRIAASVGPEGRAVGVANAEFLVADVQHEHLGGPCDDAFSRFGTMFFNLPGAAMRNIRKALTPRGRADHDRLALARAAELCVKEIVPVVSHEDTDQVHCGPGPFSVAGPDMVIDMLRAVGCDRISFERFDADICIGRDPEEAIEFAMALGPAGEIIRLAGEEGAAGGGGPAGGAGEVRVRQGCVGAVQHLVRARAQSRLRGGPVSRQGAVASPLLVHPSDEPPECHSPWSACLPWTPCAASWPSAGA